MCTAHPRVVLGLHRSRYERRLLTDALDLGIDAIDTSYNYRGFTAHKTLAAIAGDLLSHFMVSTKIGYFSRAEGSEHSLDPARLRKAVEQTNRDLGRAPDLVFLHNPERSVVDDPDPDHSRNILARACAAVSDAAAEGLCRAWGIASWDPRPLVGVLDGAGPTPDVLMVRSGLLVGVGILEAAEALADCWDLHADAFWGMSPFGGSTTDPIWNAFDPRLFLRDPAGGLSHLQAAFRLAYCLPHVNTVAVGSDDPAHLRDLVSALKSEVDQGTVQRYRSLIQDRERGQPV